MKEYIERAAVHDLVKSLPEYHMFNYDRTESRRGISPDDVDFGVDKIPAADVSPVRHGRWSSNGIALYVQNAAGHLELSRCLHIIARGAGAAWTRRAILGNGYDLIYKTSPGCTWLQEYRLKDGYHIFEVMATIASFVPPTEYYVIAKDPKEAIERFRDTYTWLDIIVSVDMCDPEKEAYICNDFHRHPVNII